MLTTMRGVASPISAGAGLGLGRDASRCLHCLRGSALVGHAVGGSPSHGVISPTLMPMSSVGCVATETNIVARKSRLSNSADVMPTFALRL